MNKQKDSTGRLVRVSRPERFQVEMVLKALDELVPRDHRCRFVWKYVEGLKLQAFYDEIKTTESTKGRSPIAPEILVALWLLATLDGIASARELDRRCKTDLPYLWILGGVSVNYHTLSDFRVNHGEKLNLLLSTSIATLIHQEVIPLEDVGQDGMRVRASAGSSSFRRKRSLEQLHSIAKGQLDELNRQRDAEEKGEAAKLDARKKAAQERAIREQERRIAAAVKEQERLAEKAEKREKGSGEKARASTTDPEAHRMKMGDGGFRPAYNVQFATDGDTRMIVAVNVTGEGTDGQQARPMLDQLEETYGQRPDHLLVDSAYATRDGVDAAAEGGTMMVSTVPRAETIRKSGGDPHARQNKDNDAFAEFRERMADEHYQELYKKRPSIAEFPNADCRNRNLKQFSVRGLAKVTAATLWYVLAFNLMRMRHLEVI